MFKKTMLPVVWVLLFFASCRNDFDKYEPPEWLAGKLYTQILEQPELSTFARCVELVGYDSIINVSGSYTVFAPTNDAFDLWISKKTEYGNVESIPFSELERLVKYHIVQNRWSKKDLRNLDIYGWIDTLDLNNDKPRGYKRETLLKEPNRKLGLEKLNDDQLIIVDTLKTNQYRMVYNDSRKYVPVFYQEYFDIYNLNSADYSFYFDRSFEGNEHLFYANGKIISDEIFADNGFIFMIDQVVDPLRNTYKILENDQGNISYSKYLDLVNIFPDFEFNKQATFDQEGAESGIKVDSLFDLSYPDLSFNIFDEETRSPGGVRGIINDVSVRYHHGLAAPTNDALNALENEFLKVSNGWGALENVPDFIKRIIVNSHMSLNPIYPSNFKNGFVNGEGDIVLIEEAEIIQKEYTSNCTFIGLNKAIVPKAFTSITGPIYLTSGFYNVMMAIEKAGLLPLLKEDNNDYMFFVEPDMFAVVDSSLLYDSFLDRFSAYDRIAMSQVVLRAKDLRTLLLNHVATRSSNGNARKEFIPNLAGNYIIVNNETGEVSGTTPTTSGFNGSELLSEIPEMISENENGKVYEINNWLSFGGSSIYAAISSRFPAFNELLIKAGLALPKEFRYNFISESEFYTVFVPTQAAIDSANLNSLPVEDLKKALQFHFVQGDLIFTDGSKNTGFYETMRIDEKSTPFNTVYTEIYIEPGMDYIQFKTKDNSDYTTILESDNTNFLTFEPINTNSEQEVFLNGFTNAVIHEIDKVLVFEKIDTQ